MHLQKKKNAMKQIQWGLCLKSLIELIYLCSHFVCTVDASSPFFLRYEKWSQTRDCFPGASFPGQAEWVCMTPGLISMVSVPSEHKTWVLFEVNRVPRFSELPGFSEKWQRCVGRTDDSSATSQSLLCVTFKYNDNFRVSLAVTEQSLRSSLASGRIYWENQY